ncbi:hypothetical protein Ancab_012446 [Ancistrocladus abbreviatus]
MGDKMENEHITIPMATHESSYHPSHTFENANPEIVLPDNSLLTASGDPLSAAEMRPPSGNTPLMEDNPSKDEKWTPALICFVVNALLLKWEADAIYNRFSNKILRADFQLYFLAVISGTYWDLFKPRKKGEMVKNGNKENGEKTMLINEMGLVENTAMEGMQKWKKQEGKEEKRKDEDSRH